jgi:hypothetical protein
MVKTFLYLRDVDVTNGPFCYVPGSHNGGRFKRFYPQQPDAYNYPNDGIVEKRFPANLRQVCTGKAGTLIFCDTTGFHKGGHPTLGARLLFHGFYTTNAGKPIITKEKKYSLKIPGINSLSPAARYAIGHLSGHESRH